MEGDTSMKPSFFVPVISIHSLRMEGDSVLLFMAVVNVGFQSTPSAWRETPKIVLTIIPVIFQSTPSAWRET